MPSNIELRIVQKRQMTLLKRITQGKISLEQAIYDLEAEMEPEDIAHVEEIAAKPLT